jgi:hypothetical protein
VVLVADLKNAVELSPLTVLGLAKRVTSDLHPSRSEYAFCYVVQVLADVATGKLDQGGAENCLRGIAKAAKPDEYREAVAAQLAAVSW